MRSASTLRVLIRLSREALAGPLGYFERKELEESLAQYERELEAMTR